MGKVPVYKDNEIVARVKYNDNLDFWDGNNFTCGSTGNHKGLTKLRKTGDYVLIHGTQWQGHRDWAEIITPNEALQEILSSRNEELLEQSKFKGLKDLLDELDEEEEPDEEY
jgi:hypothetical protein